MLEIILLIILGKRIGNIVAEKGHRRFPMQLLLVVLWFAGEVGGAIVGGVVETVAAGGQEPSFLFALLCAIAGAILGAFTAFTIARRMGPVAGPELYAEEDYPRPWDASDSYGDRAPRPPPAYPEGITDRGLPPSEPDDRIRPGP
jgi:hypothetical protein